MIKNKKVHESQIYESQSFGVSINGVVWVKDLVILNCKLRAGGGSGQ